MASPNLTELVTTTLRNRRGKLADNVLNHNALLRRLNERGNVQLESGGRTLVEELEYAENSTFKYYDGYETLDISPSDVFSAAEYEWKQAAVVVSISGKERRMNAGKEQSIKLLDRRLRNAEKTMMNNLSIGVYSDGTGSSSKQVGGLQAAVPDDPTTGTYGGINRATYTFWRSGLYDFSAESVTSGPTTIQKAMETLWLRIARGSDKPNFWVMGTTYFSHFWQSLTAIQRIASETEAASGFKTLAFYGPGGRADVFWDDAVNAQRAYALNTDYLFWRVHRDANMDPLTDRESINQDATVVPIIWMGNLTVSNSSLQGVIHE
jgi:hypothetical protein